MFEPRSLDPESKALAVKGTCLPTLLSPPLPSLFLQVKTGGRTHIVHNVTAESMSFPILVLFQVARVSIRVTRFTSSSHTMFSCRYQATRHNRWTNDG